MMAAVVSDSLWSHANLLPCDIECYDFHNFFKRNMNVYQVQVPTFIDTGTGAAQTHAMSENIDCRLKASLIRQHSAASILDQF